MPRRIAYILGVTAVGLALNVIVALGVSLCSPDHLWRAPHPDYWNSRIPTELEVRTVLDTGEALMANAKVSITHSLGCEVTRVPIDSTGDRKWDELEQLRRDFQVAAPWPSAQFVTAGWPLRSLAGEHWQHTSHSHYGSGSRNTSSVTVASLAALDLTTPRVVPFRPLLLPTLANTLVFACAAATAMSLANFLRRQVRINLGLCHVCKYPINEAQRCTECGTNVRQSVRALRHIPIAWLFCVLAVATVAIHLAFMLLGQLDTTSMVSRSGDSILGTLRLYVTTIFPFVAVPSLALLLMRRHWFSALPFRQRTILAVSIVTLSGLYLFATWSAS